VPAAALTLGLLLVLQMVAWGRCHMVVIVY
jgi:hypothetical protein